METTEHTAEFVRTVNVVYKSQEDFDEIDRFCKETGVKKGRLFARAVRVFINREKKAGRWGV
jgi:hypothetical protein